MLKSKMDAILARLNSQYPNGIPPDVAKAELKDLIDCIAGLIGSFVNLSMQELAPQIGTDC